jgi:hypothetical protein
VRRVSRIIIALSVSLSAGSVAQAREQLVMPFDCSIEQGQLKLSPAADKAYPIIGPRDEQTLTSCGFSPSTGCRTIMAHRFDISCGGSRVSWMRVVGAIGSTAAVRSWIKDDRLNVELPSQDASAAKPVCFEGPSRLGARTRHWRRGVVVSNTCLPHRGKSRFDQMILPVGYAPVREIGARLAPLSLAGDPPNVAEGTASAPAGPSLIPVAFPSDETVLAKAYPAPSWKPLLKPVTREAGWVPAALGSEWVTIVRSGDDPMAEAAAASGVFGAGSWVWLLVSMTVATVTVIVRSRTSPAWAVKAAAISPNLPILLARFGLIDLGAVRFDGEADRNLTGAGLTVAAILDQAETEVAQLKDAGPLREVLFSELGLVEQRLANVDATAAEGQEEEAKCAPQFRVLVRELQRIRRIAESAAASFSCAREPAILPKTTSEAYAILGVNPEVSESVLKKIIDALRMSWHPDHARDEADRCLREDRIRQINIACDLISQNRELA